MTAASGAPPTRGRTILLTHATSLMVGGALVFAQTPSFAARYELTEDTVRWIGLGTLFAAALFVLAAFVLPGRGGLILAGALDIAAGGTLLGLAPSAPERGAALPLVICGVLFWLFAMAALAEAGVARPRPSSPDRPPKAANILFVIVGIAGVALVLWLASPLFRIG